MTVSNTSEFTLEDEEVVKALAQGIANAIVGVDASMVKIISIEVANNLRRLAARRLSSAQVTVASEIIGAPSTITASAIQGAAAQMQQAINQELAASTSVTVSGLSASVTAKENDASPTPAPVSRPEAPPTSRADMGVCSQSVLALLATIVMFRL